MGNNQIMANYLTQQRNAANAHKRNNRYSSSLVGPDASSVSNNSLSTTSNYGSVTSHQPISPPVPVAQPVYSVGNGSMVSSQQYSNAPTSRTINSNTITENDAKRNVKFTQQENLQMASSVSAARQIADLYERYQIDLQQLQQVTQNTRIQTIETTKKALYNQREAFKKRLIETAQKLLQIVAIIKRMETELEKNAQIQGRVPFAVGKIFGQ